MWICSKNFEWKMLINKKKKKKPINKQYELNLRYSKVYGVIFLILP